MTGRLACLLAAVAVGAAAAPAAARDAEPRFFVAGDGTLALVSRGSGERVVVRYRRDDGRYDAGAIDDIRHLLRSKGGGQQGELSPRFVEVLGYVYGRVGQPLVVLSGYRSPAYNEGLRRRGRKAASGSLHTEGLAADLAVPRDRLFPLWLHLRELGCCGVGFYDGQGFLHVDVGTPRYWEAATSKADEDLRGGNARVFARTDFDRYTAGDDLLVRLHSVTAPPIHIDRRARLVPDGGGAPAPVTVEEVSAGPGASCLAADAASRLVVRGAPAMARGHIELASCAPRVERTPVYIDTNPVAIR